MTFAIKHLGACIFIPLNRRDVIKMAETAVTYLSSTLIFAKTRLREREREKEKATKKRTALTPA
jgi:hypothetical protein